MEALYLFFLELWRLIRSFVESGGDVVLVIAVVILVMWILIVERILYFYLSFPRQAERVQRLWESRPEHHSWCAQQIRRAMLAGVYLGSRRYVDIIRTLVLVCPMLGLLGTVTGMISIFDVMTHFGMGNPRLMASGVAKATIPTMTGMVGALSGVFAVSWLERTVKRRTELLADRLPTREEAGKSYLDTGGA